MVAPSVDAFLRSGGSLLSSVRTVVSMKRTKRHGWEWKYVYLFAKFEGQSEEPEDQHRPDSR